MRTISIAALAVLTSLSFSSAYAASGTAPSLIAMNQKVKSNAVSITYAYLPTSGSLAIFAGPSADHKGEKQVARIALGAGDHRNFAVKLDEQPKAGTRLWAVLEQSPKGTAPFKNDGTPVQQSFKTL